MTAYNTRQELYNHLKGLQTEQAGYFCYEDSYCEIVDCNGYNDEGDYCEQHNGSILDGVTVCVGTGGPHLELDTRYNQLIGYWSGEIVKLDMDKDVCNEVTAFWKELHGCLK